MTASFWGGKYKKLLKEKIALSQYFNLQQVYLQQ
jgi:hypothetical protein